MRWHDTRTRVSTVPVISVSRLFRQLSKFSVRTTKRGRSNVVKDHLPAFLCADILIARDVWVRGRSKTILIGLGIFGCGGEKSVHGRPSSELAPYDCSSQNTEDFAAWCKLVSKECRFNDRAGECGVVRFTTQFFYFGMKAKALPPYQNTESNSVIYMITGETQ